jgi:hypothetical protein
MVVRILIFMSFQLVFSSLIVMGMHNGSSTLFAVLNAYFITGNAALLLVIAFRWDDVQVVVDEEKKEDEEQLGFEAPTVIHYLAFFSVGLLLWPRLIWDFGWGE